MASLCGTWKTGRISPPRREIRTGSIRRPFPPDGSTLASGTEDGKVRLWDVATGSAVPQPSWVHSNPVTAVAFSPDGTLLAYGTGAKLQLWEMESGRNATTASTSFIASMAFSPDGTILALGLAERAVQLWDVTTRRTIATLKGHEDWVTSVAFSPDGKTLGAASGYGSEIKLWDMATGNAAALKEHAYWVNFVRLSPDGVLLAVGSGDRVTLWNVATGTAIQVLMGDGQWATSAAFSSDGGTLAVAQGSGVKLWDLETETHIILEAEHRAGSVAFSPNGATLAAGLLDGTVQLWALETGRTVAIAALEGHGDGPMAVAFLPDGTLLASGEEDGMVRLWDVSTGMSLAALEGAPGGNSMSSSPDGTVFATETPSGNLQLWDVTAGRRIAALEHRWVTSLAFSPDGTLLASGADGGTVKLWDASTGANLASLEGHRKAVHTMSFSPDGRTLASGGDEGTILLWDLQLILPHPQTLTKLSGDMQRGPAGTALAEPFVVSVLDQNGNPYTGATVTFAVTGGGGTLSAAAARTDANGRAGSTLTLGDVGTNTIQATVVGLEPVTYTATAEATPDFNGDGVTDLADFFLFAEAFGSSDLRFDPGRQRLGGLLRLLPLRRAFRSTGAGQAGGHGPGPDRASRRSPTAAELPQPLQHRHRLLLVPVAAGAGAPGGVCPDRPAGSGADGGSAEGRVPPAALGRSRPAGQASGHRGLRLPAGDGRGRADAQAHPASLVGRQGPRAILRMGMLRLADPLRGDRGVSRSSEDSIFA